MTTSQNWQQQYFVAFDVDGVLVDSKPQVRKAYQLAGVDMPDSVWGLPWKSWLPEFVGSYDEATLIHEAKNRYYDTLPLKLLSGAVFAKRLIDHGVPIGLLTGASEHAVRRIATELGIADKVKYIHHGCSSAMKREFLILGYNERQTVYIDDDLHRGIEVAHGIDTRLIYYTGQTADGLMEELWTQ